MTSVRPAAEDLQYLPWYTYYKRLNDRFKLENIQKKFFGLLARDETWEGGVEWERAALCLAGDNYSRWPLIIMLAATI